MSEKCWYLKNCELFQNLSAGQLQRIESQSRIRSFSANTPVHLPIEHADSVFLLAKGLLKVSNLTSDGKESTLHFLQPGELFGELALFGGETDEEAITAKAASTILMIPVREMHRLISERSDVALSLTKRVGLRRQRIERRLRNLLFLPNRERMIHLLLDLAEQFGVLEETRIRLKIKLSHQELANLIGSTRESATQILGQLRSEGLLMMGRCQIVITRMDRLARIVDRKKPQILPESPFLSPVLAMG